MNFHMNPHACRLIGWFGLSVSLSWLPKKGGKLHFHSSHQFFHYLSNFSMNFQMYPQVCRLIGWFVCRSVMISFPFFSPGKLLSAPLKYLRLLYITSKKDYSVIPLETENIVLTEKVCHFRVLLALSNRELYHSIEFIHQFIHSFIS